MSTKIINLIEYIYVRINEAKKKKTMDEEILHIFYLYLQFRMNYLKYEISVLLLNGNIKFIFIFIRFFLVNVTYI
jgi:hypothetical protein